MGQGRWKGGGKEGGSVMGRHKQDRMDEKREMRVLKRKGKGKAEVVRRGMEGTRQR